MARKKRFTEKEEQHLVDKALDSAAGSLLIKQEREKDDAQSIPKSDKTQQILSSLHERCVRLFQEHEEYEDSKKHLIRRAADQLADALREEGNEQSIPKICFTICRLIKPIKGFASDRYIRKILPAQYKDIEHRASALSRGTSSATKSQVMEKHQESQRLIADKRALNYSEKGITDYTLEDLDTVEEPAILREIAKHHMQRANYLEGELKRYQEKEQEPTPQRTEGKKKRGRPRKDKAPAGEQKDENV